MDKGSQYFQTQAADGASQSGTPLDGATTITGASFTTAGMFAGDLDRASIVVSCPSTGSPVGTIKIQGSLDANQNVHGQRPDANVATWFTMPALDPVLATYVSAQTLNGASTLTFFVNPCTVRWLRVVYTRTSGNIIPTVRCQRMGES